MIKMLVRLSGLCLVQLYAVVELIREAKQNNLV